MERIVLRCLYCGKEFIVPEKNDKFIVKCPHCGFIQVFIPDTKNLTVPTHSEEETLPRYDGTSLSEMEEVGETTLFQPEFNLENIPIPPGVNTSLKIIRGNDRGKIFHIKKARVRIGRKDCEISLDDKKVSRKHAVIEVVTRENILIRDLASKNGTFLNGVLIFNQKLSDGDIIKIGDTEMEVEIKRD